MVGQAFEFELFNPGGNMFDSDDLNRINRTFGAEFFEKASTASLDTTCVDRVKRPPFFLTPSGPDPTFAKATAK